MVERKKWMRETLRWKLDNLGSIPQPYRNGHRLLAPIIARAHTVYEELIAPDSQWPNTDWNERAALMMKNGDDVVYATRSVHTEQAVRTNLQRYLDIRIETPVGVHTYIARPGMQVVIRLDMTPAMDALSREQLATPSFLWERSEDGEQPDHPDMQYGLVHPRELPSLGQFVALATGVEYVPPGIGLHPGN